MKNVLMFSDDDIKNIGQQKDEEPEPEQDQEQKPEQEQ